MKKRRSQCSRISGANYSQETPAEAGHPSGGAEAGRPSHGALRTHLKAWLTPSRYLALMNVACAGVGFMTGVYVARVLGADKLGVTAVISGINTSIVSFVDVRFTDVAAKAFYQVEGMSPDQVKAYRAGVLWLAVLGTGLLAIVVALLSALIGNFFVPIFTESVVAGWWLPAGALAVALNTISGSSMFLLRFSGAFYAIGTWRLLLQVVSGGLTVLVLALKPGIDGVYLAGMLGALINLLLALAVSWNLWTQRGKLPMFRPAWRQAGAVYRGSLNMVFYGNLLGYAKLFQRSADVLLVAYFTGDRETGIYKLARSLIDQGLAVLQDALYQVYYPSFLDAFARRAKQEYRDLAGRLLKTSSLITLGLLAGEVLFLRPFVQAVFGPAYAGAAGPMMVLTATFVFIVGFYPWLWAIFVGSGELRGYTAAVYAAVLVQYAVALALFHLVGPSALAAMIGMLAHYVWLVPVAYWLAHRRWSAFLPWGPQLRPDTGS